MIRQATEDTSHIQQESLLLCHAKGPRPGAALQHVAKMDVNPSPNPAAPQAFWLLASKPRSKIKSGVRQGHQYLAMESQAYPQGSKDPFLS